MSARHSLSSDLFLSWSSEPLLWDHKQLLQQPLSFITLQLFKYCKSWKLMASSRALSSPCFHSPLPYASLFTSPSFTQTQGCRKSQAVGSAFISPASEVHSAAALAMNACGSSLLAPSVSCTTTYNSSLSCCGFFFFFFERETIYKSRIGGQFCSGRECRDNLVLPPPLLFRREN